MIDWGGYSRFGGSTQVERRKWAVLRCASGMLHWLTINSIRSISIDEREERRGSLQSQNVPGAVYLFASFESQMYWKDDRLRPSRVVCGTTLAVYPNDSKMHQQ
jgi:hypothetical protein